MNIDREAAAAGALGGSDTVSEDLPIPSPSAITLPPWFGQFHRCHGCKQETRAAWIAPASKLSSPLRSLLGTDHDRPAPDHLHSRPCVLTAALRRADSPALDR